MAYIKILFQKNSYILFFVILLSEKYDCFLNKRFIIANDF